MKRLEEFLLMSEGVVNQKRLSHNHIILFVFEQQKYCKKTERQKSNKRIIVFSFLRRKNLLFGR